MGENMIAIETEYSDGSLEEDRMCAFSDPKR